MKVLGKVYIVWCKHKALLFTLTAQGRKPGRVLLNGNFTDTLRNQKSGRIPGDPPQASQSLWDYRANSNHGAMASLTGSIRRSFRRTLQCAIHVKDLLVWEDQGHNLVTEAPTGVFSIQDLARGSFSEIQEEDEVPRLPYSGFQSGERVGSGHRGRV